MSGLIAWPTAVGRLRSPDDLVDHPGRSRPVRPRAKLSALTEHDEAVARVVAITSRWSADHARDEVVVPGNLGPERTLFGDVWGVPLPGRRPDVGRAWEQRPFPRQIDDLRERVVGCAPIDLLLLDTIIALAIADEPRDRPARTVSPPWEQALVGRFDATRSQWPGWQSATAAPTMAAWIGCHEADVRDLNALIRAGEALAGLWSQDVVDAISGPNEYVDRIGAPERLPRTDPRGTGILPMLRTINALWVTRPKLWDDSHLARVWNLLRWCDEPWATNPAAVQHELRVHDFSTELVPIRPARLFPPLELATRAVESGAATAADIADLLIAARREPDRDVGHRPLGTGDRALELLTDRSRARAYIMRLPGWCLDLVDEIRDRIVSIEADRDDALTAVTTAAVQLRGAGGSDMFARLVRGLGPDAPARVGWNTSTDRRPVLTRLLQHTSPGEPDIAVRAVASTGASRTQLLRVAVLAPQWALAIEAHLGLPGLAELASWLQAHTKEYKWFMSSGTSDEWQASVERYSNVDREDLTDGAIDVTWFRRIEEVMPSDDIDQVLSQAKFASSGTGHVRARRYADALRGKIDQDEIDSRLDEKRDDVTVRALGVVPLPTDPEARHREVIARHARLVAWQDGEPGAGFARRRTIEQAVRIGRQNLARAAGYGDPRRMTWVLEADTVSELLRLPNRVAVGDLTIALVVDDGLPRLVHRRGSRELKRLPRGATDDPAVGALVARSKELEKIGKRMLQTLEDAMVAAETFEMHELERLCTNPMFAQQLATLVLTDGGGRTARRTVGGALVGPSNRRRKVEGPLRIAHPVDIGDELASWQVWLEGYEKGQPVRQLQRVTFTADQGIPGATTDGRFSQQDVRLEQTVAVLARRGWIGEKLGHCQRSFVGDRVTAYTDLDIPLQGVSFADVGCIQTTFFIDVRSGQPIPLADVPNRVYSETMRDLSLVVAAAGA